MYRSIIIVLCLFITYSFSEKRDYDIVKELFPGSVVDTFDNYFGFKNEKVVLTSFIVRNKSAFIPLSDIIYLKLNSDYSVIAFPIYLANKNKLLSNIVKDRVGNDDEERQKLIQFLFITNNGKVIGKPDGFPLVTSTWTCLGDFCDNIHVTDLEKISGKSNTCKLIYTKGVEQEFYREFTLVNNKILSTEEIFIEDADN